MAMSKTALQQLLGQHPAGATFVLGASQLGIPVVNELFTGYLPAATLTVHNATADSGQLSLVGEIDLLHGDSSAPVAVTFQAPGTVVTALSIRVVLSTWSFTTTGSNPLELAAPFLTTLLFQQPHLILEADSSKGGYFLYLSCSYAIQTPGGTESVSLLLDVPVSSKDNYLLEGEFDHLTLPDLGHLDRLFPAFPHLGFSTLISGLAVTLPLASELRLNRLALLVNPIWNKILSVSVEIGSAHPWSLAGGQFSLSSFDLSFVVTLPSSAPEVSCTVTAALDLGHGITLDSTISLPDLNLEAELPGGQTLDLSDVLTGIWPASGLTPGALTVDKLKLDVDLKTHGYLFDVRVIEDLPLLGDLTLTKVSLSVWGTGTATPEGDLAAIFEVGDVAFIVSVARRGGAWRMFGRIQNPIRIGDLLAALATRFGVTLPLPEALAHLAFDDVAIAYDSGSNTFTFNGASTGHGDIVFVATKGPTHWRLGFYAEVEIQQTLDFPPIPLVGSKIDPLGLERLALRVLSDPPPAAAVLTSNHFGEPPFAPGVSVAATLRLGSQTFSKSAQLTGGGSGGTSLASLPAAASVEAGHLTAVPPTRTDQIAWLEIDKEFGPVAFHRIGFGFDDSGRVSITPDVTVSLSILEVDLDGLSVSFALDDPSHVNLSLDSLALSYSSPELTISGGFKHHHSATGDVYEGEALIKAMQYQLTAIGAFFHRPPPKPPSLFLYLSFDGELGGPPFFFVTGLAGGFGYNYSLKTPDIDGVRSFPFVDLVMGNGNALGSSPDPEKVLNALDPVVAPQVGEDWLAAGLRFSTFEMLDSFALLTVQIGTHFEIALLGLSTLTVPIDDPDPIARAQLALEVDFSPSSDLLKVEGRLTPASFILSPDCRLTGGFAFYTWFAGPHAGDFVITLGGYHPAFQKPAHYPSEPRVGYRWQIGSELHLDGGIYFALTPAAVMAGARLDASYRSGGLHAWFNEHADFLLLWKPFHYDASLGFEIGVSYTIHIWFIHKTISVHLGVGVHLWGPPFGGVAKFHVGPFHVSIYFGNGSRPARLPIPWSEFATSFLPAAGSIVRTSISRGTIKGPQASYSGSIVKAADLQLEIKTVIPIKTGSFNGQAFSASDFQQQSFAAPGSPSWATDFGVGPCALPDGSVGSACTITLGHSNDPGGTKTPVATGEFLLRPTLASSPTSLWGPYRELGDGSWLNDDRLVSDTLTQFTLSYANPPPIGHQTGPFPVAELLYSYDPSTDERHFHWSPASRPSSDTFDQSQAMSQLEQTVDAPSVVQTRHALLAALNAQGLAVDTQPDLSQMAGHAADVLLASPVLSLLGEKS